MPESVAEQLTKMAIEVRPGSPAPWASTASVSLLLLGFAVLVRAAEVYLEKDAEKHGPRPF